MKSRDALRCGQQNQIGRFAAPRSIPPPIPIPFPFPVPSPQPRLATALLRLSFLDIPVARSHPIPRLSSQCGSKTYRLLIRFLTTVRLSSASQGTG